MFQRISQQGSAPRSQETAEIASPVELSVQYHAGNPNLCRVPDLKIGVMPECEGGGWYMPRAQAEIIVKAVNGRQALLARIARLEADLNECREFIEAYVDTVDSDDGPAPNRAMTLVITIDETLNGRPC